MIMLKKRFALAIIALLLSACSSTPETPSTSVRAATKATQIAEKDQPAYNKALGDVEKAPEVAVTALTKIATANPGYMDAWVNLAIAHYKLNQIEAARLAVDNAHSLAPNSAVVNNVRGLVSVAEGLYLEAEKQYLASLAADSKQANTHYNLALLYDMYFQDIARAIPQYERYLALTVQKDDETSAWTEELKHILARRGNP